MSGWSAASPGGCAGSESARNANPPGNRGVVDGQSPLCHHLFHIALAQWIPQIPAHTKKDHLTPKVSSPKQYRLPLTHSLHRTKARRFRFATQPNQEGHFGHNPVIDLGYQIRFLTLRVRKM